jgi:hypothetical protein
MRNTPANDAPGSFWQVGKGEAARRLEAILADEDAGVLTVYDPNGGYGHPDHIKVNWVGLMAARLARTPRVFEATLNRDLIVRQRRERPGGGPPLPDVDGIDETMGLPEAELTAAVDVTGYLDRKRAAMAAHASQISDASYFLSLGPGGPSGRNGSGGPGSAAMRITPGPPPWQPTCSRTAWRKPDPGPTAAGGVAGSRFGPSPAGPAGGRR